MRLEYFELLDRVEEMDLDAGTIRVLSTLPETSPVFEGHFPRFPILPGVLMLEAMNHAAGYLLYRRFKRERFVFLGGIKRAKFRRMVKPGARLDVRGKISYDGSGFFIAETSLTVDNEVAADAEIVLIVQDFPSAEAKAALAESTDRIAFADTVAV
ncbi:MAG: 3-hydroxyacyl-ACP dehydratase FabZ family protein [Allosphingosinicella sp.]